MKKCCLNCAFCARYINNSANSLTVEEHTQALAGNFDFIGKEQRARKEWQLRYKRIYDDLRTGKYNDKLGGMNVLEILMHANNPDDFTEMHIPDPIIERFELPSYPDAPYQDFLACVQDLWSFKNKTNDFSGLNKKNKCLFFYPYNRKGNKSFEACEKERSASQDKRRFEITNWLVILGIGISILTYFFPRNDTGKLTISIDSVETLDNDNTPTTTIKLSNPQKD